ncbi:hypothetical protein BMF77_04767 [Dolichospermum sp. UHCC 0315A]|jgi:transposase|uniref:IS630 family transposase n=2 Tax=Dolichospermum TaxID=748770 RepID=UPI0011E87A11|nr:IS630 family transposase [Dolichospermum sp. UHCC 0315A]QEI44136.1 hypothetical protein BMF77_04767 [Dolichospermum sp. UHCC 0315A]
MKARTYSTEEKAMFHYERFNHPHPRVQIRMEVMWLKSKGLKNSQIVSLVNMSENTVREYIKEYEEGGIEKLKEINFYRPESELLEYKETLEKYFEKNPPMSIKEAAKKIEELTGIKRSENQVRLFIKRIGMKRLKVGYVPGNADVEAQKEYQEKKLEPLLEEARQGKRAVFFVDAAHFVMKAFLGYIWCVTRVFIKSPSGRKRFNVLAALNAINHQVITVTNDTYITGQQVCELLQKLYDLGLTIPITLVLDNARYQKCRVVLELAESLGIDLLFLPAYSPNLNLIERLWKWVKKKCLYGQYYEDFSDFKNAISTAISQTHLSYKEEMKSLLTLKFQTFEKTQVVTL